MNLQYDTNAVPQKQRDSATDIESILESVANHQLPESLTPLLVEYDETIGCRDPFLWRWAHNLFPSFTLSCVPKKDSQIVQNDKFLALMFISVLDDIAEKNNDLSTFHEAAQIPFEHRVVNHDRADIDPDVLSFAETVWSRLSPDLRKGDQYQEFSDIFQFDLKQVLDAIEYSYLANTNTPFVTENELRSHETHNMMTFIFADIDLIHSPDFERTDLPNLRRVVDRAQRMVRIGNWITTWERELHEGDLSSGIVVYALEQNIITNEDIENFRAGDQKEETIEKLVSEIYDRDVEAIFFDEWREELAAAREFEGEFASINISAYLDGIETVMDYHLASRGFK